VQKTHVIKRANWQTSKPAVNKKLPTAKKERYMLGSAASATPQPEAPVPVAPPRRAPKDYGEPLNFRVSPRVGEQFCMVAIRRKLKLHQLLQKCFEVYLREEGEGIR
jgi:hypothetical protein